MTTIDSQRWADYRSDAALFIESECYALFENKYRHPKLYPLQRHILKRLPGVSRAYISMGRKTGKTATVCFYLLWGALFHPNELILLVAPSRMQNRELAFSIIVESLKRNEPLMRAAGVTITKNEIHFAITNSKIVLVGKGKQYAGGRNPSAVMVDEVGMFVDDDPSDGCGS